MAQLLLAESSARLFAERKIRFIAGDDVAEHLLVNGGYDAALGARPMRSAVQRLVEAELAERILAGVYQPGDVVEVVARNGALEFAVSGPRAAPPARLARRVPGEADET